MALKSLRRAPTLYCRRIHIRFLFSALIIALSFLYIYLSLSLSRQNSPAPQVAVEQSIRAQSTHKGPPVAVFYHIYIPVNQGYEGVANAFKIVREQIGQIGSSFAASLPGRPLTVFYSTVGLRALNEMYMNRLCHGYNIVCKHMQHKETGFEEVTLQKVKDYCRTHDESDRVVYIHTKGSFHRQVPGIGNEIDQDVWRRHGTDAALSELCLRPANDTCNACSLFWTVFPWIHTPGNFWTAKCSYIRELDAPIDYEKNTIHFLKNELYPRTKNMTIATNLFPVSGVSIAAGRFAMENWIGSHPSIVPCDLSDEPGMRYWQTVHRNTSDWQWAMAPRHDFHSILEATNKRWEWVLNVPTKRFRDYLLLAGMILKWNTIYRAMPPPKSWIWTFYPDGNIWREGAEKFGGDRVVDLLTKQCLIEKRNCIEAVAKALSSPADIPPQLQGSPTNKQQGNISIDFAFDPTTSPPFALFYNIYVPSDKGDEGKQNALRIVKEQLGQIGNSYAASVHRKPVSVYYNTIGYPAINTSYMDHLCAANGHLHCSHMQHIESGFEDVTLQKVYEFCKMNDDLMVGYLHSKGSFHAQRGENERWRKSLTDAATSELCLNPPNDTCNVCGLQFFPLWAPFYIGNMWAAQCKYVKNLIPPEQYGSEMRSLDAEVWIRAAQGRLRKKFFNPTEDKLGLGRYSAEHWIGSHPSLIPCDLSQSLHMSYWRRKSHNSSEFSFAMAPRRPISNRTWSFNTNTNTYRLKVLSNEIRRLKEYFLLGGQIFKWLYLYDELPKNDSWVWSWFPDGERWQQAAARHGSRVHLEMTQKIMDQK